MPADEHAAVHKSRGAKFVNEGRFSEAERELEEATSPVPGDRDARISLAQVLEAEGKHQEAAGEHQTALKLQDSLAGASVWPGFIFPSVDRSRRARKPRRP